MRFVSRPLIAVVLLGAFANLSGCAPMIANSMNRGNTPEVVAAKTAKYFGAAPQDIQVLNYESGALATTYQVRHAGKFFNCRIYYGEVTCQEPGKGPF